MAKNTLECFDVADFALNFYSRRSRPPSSLEELNQATHLVLVHITTSTFLESIRIHGLLPDFHKERRVDDNLPSNSTHVYLGCRLDSYYFGRAEKHRGGKGIAVVAEVERALLDPDDSGRVGPTPITTEQATEPHDVMLYKSLCFEGCMHRGVILPSRFRGIYNRAGILIPSGLLPTEI